jgi:lipid-A-disaccharide synthase
VKLLVSVAEPSGDVLAAEVVRALRLENEIEVRGVTGPALREAGVVSVADVSELAVNGVFEVLGHLSALHAVRKRLLQALEWRPDLLLCVDGPDFNLPLASLARTRGVRTVGLVAPQVWAWRPGRTRTAARSYQMLLCLFPFEPELFRPSGLDARFVGHPVADRLAGQRRRPETGVYGLLPGSRENEIRTLLPVFLETARHVLKQRPEARFRIGVASSGEGEVDRVLARIVDGAFLQRLECCDGLLPVALSSQAALVASGTATLELALLDVPMVAVYRVHPATFLVGRALVRGVTSIALPNILAGRIIVPEHVQRLHPCVLARDLLSVAEEPADMMEAMGRIRQDLGAPGASLRIAEALVELARA